MATTKASPEIQQAALYRCTDKATREVFYVVKSDSQADTWYMLHFDRRAVKWTCDCPATKPCKHIRAVLDLLKIRRARLAEQIGGDMPDTIAALEAEEKTLGDLAEEIVAEERRRKATPARQCETWDGEENTPTYGPLPVMIFGCARTTACKRAKQFADMPLNGNGGFSLLKPAH